MKTYLVNTRQRADEAMRRGDTDERRDSSQDLLRAVIIGANGGGYDVATIDRNGNAARVYQRCYAWPSDASLNGGDEVWLKLSVDGETAEIVVSGSSNSCFQSVNEWGVYFG